MKKLMKVLLMIILLVVLAILIALLYMETSGGKTKKAELLKTGASEVISQVTGKEVDVQEFMDENMSEEDAAFVNEVLEEKVDLGTVKSAVSEYQQTGTVSDSVVNSVKESLTEEEKEKALELYQQYGDAFLQYLE